MPLLPTDPSQFEAALRDDSLAVATAEALAKRHGLDGEASPLKASTLACSVGRSAVTKVFEPADLEFRNTEVEVLNHLDGRLPVATPRVVATGDFEGWPYIVMTRLPGRTLADCRGELSHEQLLDLSEQVGRLVGALHDLPTGSLKGGREDWRRWTAGQREACLAFQKSTGLSDRWLEELPAFLDSVELGLDGEDWPLVLLHTEVMDVHVLVEGLTGSPDAALNLSGFVDFEPSVLGHPEYELASTGLFVTRGQPGLFEAFMKGYGREHDPELSSRALAWALLHRYSSLAWFLRELGEPEGSPDLHALARRWWSRSR